MTTSTAIDRRVFVLAGNIFPNAVVSGGNWALSPENLGIANLYQDIARCGTGALADAVFTATWAETQTIGGLCLIGYTGPGSGRIRLTWERNGNTVGTPSWEDIHPRVADTIDLPYGAGNWWSGRGKGPFFFIPSTPMRADALTVEIDARGEPFDLSYLFAAPLTRPEWPMAWGRQLQPKSRTKIARTLGGMIIPGPRLTPQRAMSLTFQEPTKLEAMQLFDIGMEQDVVEPVLVVPDPGDPNNYSREVFLATLAELPGFEEASPDRYPVNLKVEEIVA